MSIKMAYEVIVLCHLHMPLYYIGAFTEYPYMDFVPRYEMGGKFEMY